jgi:hypothetical protein
VVLAVVAVALLVEEQAGLELLIRVLQEQMVTGARPFKAAVAAVQQKLEIPIQQVMAAMVYLAT